MDYSEIGVRLHERVEETVQRERKLHVAEVLRPSPLQVELQDSGKILDEEDELVVGQWVRAYRASRPLVVGDEVLVDRRDGRWVVAEVLSDTSVEGNHAFATKAYADAVGASGGASYVHPQNVASDVWVIAHNRGEYPSSVVLLDNDNPPQEFWADVEFTSINVVTIRLGGSQGGKAILGFR